MPLCSLKRKKPKIMLQLWSMCIIMENIRNLLFMHKIYKRKCRIERYPTTQTALLWYTVIMITLKIRDVYAPTVDNFSFSREEVVFHNSLKLFYWIKNNNKKSCVGRSIGQLGVTLRFSSRTSVILILLLWHPEHYIRRKINIENVLDIICDYTLLT